MPCSGAGEGQGGAVLLCRGSGAWRRSRGKDLQVEKGGKGSVKKGDRGTEEVTLWDFEEFELAINPRKKAEFL